MHIQLRQPKKTIIVNCCFQTHTRQSIRGFPPWIASDSLQQYCVIFKCALFY